MKQRYKKFNKYQNNLYYLLTIRLLITFEHTSKRHPHNNTPIQHFFSRVSSYLAVSSAVTWQFLGTISFAVS